MEKDALMEKDVPYLVYQGTMARFERTIKRLVIALAITIVLLCASNFYWAYFWSMCDFSDVTIDSQDGGNANYIGENGVINNGESDSQETDGKE